MTQFEKLLNQTNTLTEALTLQPCLSDGKPEWQIDLIRYNYIEKKFGLQRSEIVILGLLIDISKRRAFEKAISKTPRADMVSMCIRSHG